MKPREIKKQAMNIYRALLRRSSPRPSVQCHGMHMVGSTWNDLRLVYDDGWYRRCYPDVTGNGLAHYLARGWREGRDPSPVFGTRWYLEQYPDIGAAAVNPLVHYLQYGGSLGRDPHPLFSTPWYLEQNPDVAMSGMNPLVHYVLHGGSEGRNPHPLLDAGWYLKQNPEVASLRMNPLAHYVQFGASEGRDPHPMFSTRWYLEQNPDVAALGINPLLHYVQYGASEGRHPHPTFNTRRYLERNPDVASLRMNPLVHYVQFGIHEGRRCSPADVEVLRAPAAPLLDIVKGLQSEFMAMKENLASHAKRIDGALGLVEGVFDMAADLEKARGSADFRAPFERSNPLVSVCVATCNRATILIDRCIRSLLAQSYSNLQIVVVGDHCTDDTAYRIAQLHDSRIVFENLPRRGPYPASYEDRWRVAGTNATNRALDLAEGDFVAHLDDDDEAAVDRVETLLRHARSKRAEFCWHPFWYEGVDGTWRRLGNGEFTLGQMTTGSIFYHRYYARIKWDVQAYRLEEPGDWNRLRKIKSLRPTMAYIDKPLVFHYQERNQGPFVAQLGETFLN